MAARKDDERQKRRAEHHAALLQGLANQPPIAHDADCYSVDEFCRRHRISVQVFYKYPDLMPASFFIGKRRLISREAAERWRRERAANGAVA